MDTAMFYDDCAYLAEWPGPPIGDEEGRIIHEALGDKRAILLAHHGQLVATTTIEEAAVLAVFIERAARMQVIAQSIGSIKPIDPAIAREAHDVRLHGQHNRYVAGRSPRNRSPHRGQRYGSAFLLLANASGVQRTFFSISLPL